MWTHGGPTEPPSVLECQFLPNLALLLSGAESCIIGCYFCAAAAEMGELGAASEHQPFSTHVLSGYALHVHAKCSFPPAAPRGRGPQAEPQPLEGIWRTSDQRVAGVWPEDEPAMPACPPVACSKCYRSAFLVLSFCSCPWALWVRGLQKALHRFFPWMNCCKWAVAEVEQCC